MPRGDGTGPAGMGPMTGREPRTVMASRTKPRLPTIQHHMAQVRVLSRNWMR